MLEGRKKEQAAYVAQQIALRKEVLRLKREKEEERCDGPTSEGD